MRLCKVLLSDSDATGPARWRMRRRDGLSWASAQRYEDGSMGEG